MTVSLIYSMNTYSYLVCVITNLMLGYSTPCLGYFNIKLNRSIPEQYNLIRTCNFSQC